MIDIRPVESSRDLGRFIDLPTRLQAGDPAYVVPLRMERRQALSPKTNPFFNYADVQFWIAWREGRVVGRISAQADRRLPGIGHFGMLAAEDDPGIFAALFSQVGAWHRTRGNLRIQGPFDLSINEEVGVLVDGFETPPMLLMGHNPRTVPGRIEAQGYAKVKDLYAYLFDARSDVPAWADRLVGRQSREGVVLRHLDWKRYDEDLASVVDIFNDAWSQNWNFLPLGMDELNALAKSLRPLIHKSMVQIVDVGGEPAAFGIGLPNLNEAVSDLGGRLAPFGWAKLLWRLKVRGVSTSRVPLMGVRRRYAKTPLGSALALMIMNGLGRESVRLGMDRIELSWILEDNLAMRHLCEAIAGPPYKTYRLYEKALSA